MNTLSKIYMVVLILVSLPTYLIGVLIQCLIEGFKNGLADTKYNLK